MSYYILPKIYNILNVNPKCSHETCHSYISYSLIYNYNLIKQQIANSLSPDDSFDLMCKLINQYEYIFSKVPGSKYSVSKLKPNSNIFYDLYEISCNLNIFKFTEEPINILHLSPNYCDSIECFEMIRENKFDNHIYFNADDVIDALDYNILNKKYDLIFCETNPSNYFISFINSVISILKNQNTSGTTIIKIIDIFHKPSVDILYFLSSLYEKVCIYKPTASNIVSFDRYIVCKNLLQHDANSMKLNYLRLLIFIKKLEGKHVISLFDFDIPKYFKNKIDEMNIIIGQQQLDALNQIMTINKNKNKNEKIENLKKNNIHKSVSWCEKYKIPCNKFTEKINIFLPIINNEATIL